MEPLFLAPLLKEKIWGGEKITQLLNLPQTTKKIGEDWVISAHQNGHSVVMNGTFKGQKLIDVWQHYPKLFNNENSAKAFPLLVKIIDAAENLSVQVHPNDRQASRLAGTGELGKTECWYIMAAEPDAEIIYGHTAQTKQQFKQQIADQLFESLFKRVSVKKGDFFYVPSGTVHAIGKGIVILETQQSSDTTYRLYDYDRFDKQLCRKRTLHLHEAQEVTTVPFTIPKVKSMKKTIGTAEVRTFIENEFFKVEKWSVQDVLTLQQENHYTLVTVIEGKGQMRIDTEVYDLAVGASFILPVGITEWQIIGQIELIAANPGNKIKR